MKNLVTAFLLTIITVLTISCKKENDAPKDQINCSDFAVALLAGDVTNAQTEIDKYLLVLNKDNAARPPTESFNLILTQLDNCDNLQVIDACYECIETVPRQSLITVSVFADGTVTSKSIDLLTQNTTLKVVGIHD